jgi:hypothetical protein
MFFVTVDENSRIRELFGSTKFYQINFLFNLILESIQIKR